MPPWKESYLWFLCSMHERLGAKSPAQLVSQWTHREIAELVREKPNRWHSGHKGAEVSKDGRTISQKVDCSNFMITTEEPILPGEIGFWRITIIRMDTDGKGTMRYYGVNTKPSDETGIPARGEYIIRVCDGYLLDPGCSSLASPADRRTPVRAKTRDVFEFELDRRVDQPHTLRMKWNDVDCGVIFDKLPKQSPLYPCVTQQHETDVITADFY